MKLKAILFTAISSLFVMSNTYAANPSLDELRTRFNKWQSSYQSLTNIEQQKLLDSLKDYPLYPYVQYQYMNANMATLTVKDVNNFVKNNSDFPLASSLMQNYIAQLNKQQQWDEVKKLDIDKSIASRCSYQYALLKLGEKKLAFEPIKSIWLSADDLPSACNPIFDQWSNSGEKTANLILLRIELVLKKNNIKLARHLTEQLPDSYKTLKSNLLALYSNPNTLPEFAKKISPTPFSQNIINLSFARFASQDPDKAKGLIPTIVKQQKLSANDENMMYRTIANNYFKDSATDKQIEWRRNFIAKDRNTLQIEREIRLSLKNNKLKDVAYWLNLLSPQDKLKDEWQYWQAMTLINSNKVKEANDILNNLQKSRGFYAMYSAQQQKKPFNYNFNYSIIDGISSEKVSTILNKQYDNDPIIKRIEELRYWHMLPEATREWRNYLYSNINNKKYPELARYSYNKGWAEHSVQATIAGKLWDNWLERFPVIYQDIFTKSLATKAIPLSYSLAIARQESALDATVQSPAGARGLMQLMPATAKDSAKKVGNLAYNSADQLYDPAINIELGTYYLDYVYKLFDNNRILASAAYNAGPNRVTRWLKESNGQLDAAAFIESIPFTETRNYVKSVLVYDYIYELMLNHKPNTVLHDNEVKYKY